jgi:hypothetical protein
MDVKNHREWQLLADNVDKVAAAENAPSARGRNTPESDRRCGSGRPAPAQYKPTVYGGSQDKR